MSELKIDLEEIRFNPVKIQRNVLDAIEINAEANITLTDPTNPFLMLMEANISLTNDALNENVVNLRRTYPSLATKATDLYHHISDIEAINMYAVPSKAVMLITVNLKQLIESGYEVDNKILATIPEFTYITVDNTKFTILNNIRITYFKDSKKINIEQLTSTNDIAIKDIGVLKNIITVDENNNSWVQFETLVRQTERHVIEDSIISGMGFKKEVILDDQYYTTNVFVKNQMSNNVWKKINVSHSDIVFDPNIPTIHIKVLDDRVIYSVPEIYLLNNTITGSIKLEIYTSKGKLTLNLHKIPVNEYILTLGNTTDDESTAVMENIITIPSSRNILDGGRDQRTMEELRTTIIENTTGQNTLPITQNEIEEISSYDGFNVTRVLDVVTDRYFIATKSIPEPLDKKVKSKMDVFLNKIHIISDEYSNNDFIKPLSRNRLVMRSGTTFINENNVVKPLSNTEYKTLKNLTSLELVKTLSENKYFVTPFYYITDIISGSVKSRIFDFDSPKLSNLTILSKNTNEVSANVEQYTTYTNSKGFVLVFTVVGNSKYEEINTSNIKAQLSIKLPNSVNDTQFYATMDPVTKYLKFEIATDFFVDEVDHITILNGNSELKDLTMDLISNISLIIYTNDPNIVKTSYSVTNDIVYDKDINIMALSKETLELNLGKEFKYLWNNVSTDYTERKYSTYKDNVPMTYVEDIYDVHEDGSIFTPVDTDDDGECDDIEYNILHHKGDLMYDDEGNQLYKHSKGDVKHDDRGNPVIDGYSGIIRYLDILMLEYEYTLTLTVSYTDYKENVLKLLRLYIDKNMSDLNERMLDNTAIFYSPSRTNANSEINVGLNKFLISSVVRPKVVLYILKSSPILNDKISYLRSIIGMIIHKHLDTNNINLNTIKDDIIFTFGDGVKGVKILGLDGELELEIFKVNFGSSKLSMAKKISYDVSNNIMIEYDIDIEIHQM